MRVDKDIFVVKLILAVMIAVGIMMTSVFFFPLVDKPQNSSCCSADTCVKEGHHK